MGTLNQHLEFSIEIRLIPESALKMIYGTRFYEDKYSDAHYQFPGNLSYVSRLNESHVIYQAQVVAIP